MRIENAGGFCYSRAKKYYRRYDNLSILESIKTHEDLCAVPADKLPELCGEIRAFLIESISRTGGHLASNLGTVELSVALDRVYDPWRDRIVFDVGHQCYTHKLLTGRMAGFEKLRHTGGVSGFPKPSESCADAFIAGHASNSVAVALGMARARTQLHGNYDVCAVIGDGALTGGLAYEGLSNAGQSGEPMVVILNDNAMSIRSNVGGMARLLSRMRVRPAYFEFKRRYRQTVGKVKPVYNAIHAVKESVKEAVLPANVFDDLGFYYLGPVDGHDLHELESALTWAREMQIPVLLHVITQKGRGYPMAELHPDKYHGVGRYDPLTGELEKGGESFSGVFGRELVQMASADERLMAITAAMADGTGLTGFEARYPKRFFDVGIAEGGAVSMAAGMAKQGAVPVAAIYSTFLQRAYDQLIHDIALLKLHVVLCVDRAGLVGEDGETHHGVFDLAYLSTVPGLALWCPASFAELRDMLRAAVYESGGPVALRYPRGGEGRYTSGGALPVRVIGDGSDAAIVVYGTMVNEALDAAGRLERDGLHVRVIKLGRVCPLPADELFSALATDKVVFAEEVCSANCVGEQLMAEAALRSAALRARLLNLGSGIVGQGTTPELRSRCGIDSAAIAAAVKELCNEG